MITFHEYLKAHGGTGLPDAQTMLLGAGISPAGPHEVELLKIMKRWKKGRPRGARQPLGLADPAPGSVEK